MVQTQPYNTTHVDGSELDPAEWNQLASDIGDLIEQGIHVGVLVRMGDAGQVYTSTDGGTKYVVVRGTSVQGMYDSSTHADLANQYETDTSIIVMKEYTYGTYEWRGHFNKSDVWREWMGFEHHHGHSGEGIVGFQWVGTDNKFYACVARESNSVPDTYGSYQTIDITTAMNAIITDRTTDHLFKIVWAAGSVAFYVDGSLVQTITDSGNPVTTIPTFGCFFLETYMPKYGYSGSQASYEAKVKLVSNSFQQDA